jgi:monovalent cation/hydrogen antiporter
VHGLEIVLLLVVLATAVAAVAGRYHVPAPSLLVLAGVVVAFVPGVPAVQVPPELVSVVVLPPLLYAAGQDLPWRELRPVWRPVTVLAIGLVIASAGAVGAVAAAVMGLPASMALVLGAVLASTDPVAVTALGRELPLPARLQALIQAESLFNDATSLVLVRVAVTAAAAGGALQLGSSGVQFAVLAGGGALAGAAIAAAVTLIRARTEDPVLETVTALATPYLAYVVAESLHVSGITAVVVASVVLAGRALRLSNAGIRLQVHAVYDTVVFVLESVVFILIGLQLPTLIRGEGFGDWTWSVEAVAIAAVLLVVRALWVFPLSVAAQSRRGGRISWRIPAIVSWAGARGVLPLAAALSIPLTTAQGNPLEGRNHVVLLTTAVIVITLLVQGFTLGPLVRWAGVATPPSDARDDAVAARSAMTRAALDHLEHLEQLEAAPNAAIVHLRRTVQDRLTADDNGPDPVLRLLRRELIAVETAELTRLYAEGAITEATRRELQRHLDLEDASLDY